MRIILIGLIGYAETINLYEKCFLLLTTMCETLFHSSQAWHNGTNWKTQNVKLFLFFFMIFEVYYSKTRGEDRTKSGRMFLLRYQDFSARLNCFVDCSECLNGDIMTLVRRVAGNNEETTSQLITKIILIDFRRRQTRSYHNNAKCGWTFRYESSHLSSSSPSSLTRFRGDVTRYRSVFETFHP